MTNKASVRIAIRGDENLFVVMPRKMQAERRSLAKSWQSNALRN
jgi:hypothetical protein